MLGTAAAEALVSVWGMEEAHAAEQREQVGEQGAPRSER